MLGVILSERDRPRPRPSENEEEEEHEHDNTELAQVAIQQLPEISELLKPLTPRIEMVIAQTLKVQEPPAHPCQLSQEPGPSNDPRSPLVRTLLHLAAMQPVVSKPDANAVELRKLALKLARPPNVIKVVQVILRQIVCPGLKLAQSEPIIALLQIRAKSVQICH